MSTQGFRRAPLVGLVALCGLGCRAPAGTSAGAAATSVASSPSSAAPVAAGEAAIRFLRHGAPVARYSRAELEQISPPRRVSVYDPFYKRQKSFRAMPLGPLLARAYPGVQVASEDWIVRARDGFTVPVRGPILVEEGALLADADAEGPWEPIGPEHADPAPFYLIWEREQQLDPATHPRPWKIESFDIARFEDLFSHTLPPRDPGPASDGGVSAPERGFALFRVRCLPCHAINREGGRTGPELNVPQNVTEYRPVAQIRAYIRNPLSFRYGNMPPHPDLSEANLDDLLAYLAAMKDHKHDPEAK